MTVMRPKPDAHCGCPPCGGLEKAERPRFGTGMTLTAADLTALLDYVRTKDRLHNRYQHGHGVVCGLEVLCHDCEGSVTIRPGYALDPCGNDIVVADKLRFDVMAAIQDCLKTDRRRGDACDPWMPAPDQGCREAESHWCVALRYREVETAIGQRLTTGGTACDTIGKSSGSRGDCGCGGGADCGCGCGDARGQACGCTSQTEPVTDYTPPSHVASNACAPRRVQECFEVCLVPHKEPCAPEFPRPRDPIGVTNNQQPLGLIGWLIPEKSLLRNILNCVIHDTTALTDGLSAQDTEVISRLGASDAATLAASDLSLDDVHLALCHARAVVLELLQDDGGATRCQLLRATAETKLAPPARGENGEGGENRADYIARAQDSLRDLVAAWIQGILDCICRAFLPDCPEPPCEDKVEIACLTVKGGQILNICNHSCRSYAGSFPAMSYWMSLVPIVPLFARLLAMLCCQPDLLRRNSPLVNDLMPLLDRVDPTGRLRTEIVKNDFELPRRFVGMAAKFADTPVLNVLSTQAEQLVARVLDPAPEVKPLRTEVEELRAELAELRSIVAPDSVQQKPERKSRARKYTPKPKPKGNS